MVLRYLKFSRIVVCIVAVAALPIFARNKFRVGEYVVSFESIPVRSSDPTLKAKDQISDLGLQELSPKQFLYVSSEKDLLSTQNLKSEKNKLQQMKEDLEAKTGKKVKYLEPNFLYYTSGGSRPPVESEPPARRNRDNLATVFPNDPKFSDLWGMSNKKQNDSNRQKGDGRADIWAPQAWSLFKGAKTVVVAVIDTGIDYNHVDLKENMWSENGTHGYNAITNTLDPMDDQGHGTHCAGTIGAVGSNGIGVAGVTWNVQLMGVKFLSGSGSGTLADAIKAIRWAVDHGADILSNSWGGGSYSDNLKEAIEYAASKDVLFVAAAGNEKNNNDSKPSYPATYDVANIVSVAASDNLDKLASFSNYGKTRVHISAPGVGIFSTLPGQKYGFLSGTSMATPHVSGAAALLKAYRPALSALQLKESILKSAEKVSTLNSVSQSGGRLNVYDMLNSNLRLR